MSVHKELLVVIKDVETLMEVLSILVMWDIYQFTKHIMMIQPIVLVWLTELHVM